ncbi:hypothetical protein WJX84_007481 [Apatococcus fuscideae]|uniref:Uncharacterized protein n=1 Tax=Apatococcus fuscideae TaxID=2026836 RepID=A0AAW1ST90_9CHLO
MGKSAPLSANTEPTDPHSVSTNAHNANSGNPVSEQQPDKLADLKPHQILQALLPRLQLGALAWCASANQLQTIEHVLASLGACNEKQASGKGIGGTSIQTLASLQLVEIMAEPMTASWEETASEPRPASASDEGAGQLYHAPGTLPSGLGENHKPSPRGIACWANAIQLNLKTVADQERRMEISSGLGLLSISALHAVPANIQLFDSSWILRAAPGRLKIAEPGKKFQLTQAAPVASISIKLAGASILIDGNIQGVQLQLSEAAVLGAAMLQQAWGRVRPTESESGISEGTAGGPAVGRKGCITANLGLHKMLAGLAGAAGAGSIQDDLHSGMFGLAPSHQLLPDPLQVSMREASVSIEGGQRCEISSIIWRYAGARSVQHLLWCGSRDQLQELEVASIKLSLCAPDGLNLLDSPCRCLPAAGLLQDLQTPFPIEAAMFIVPQMNDGPKASLWKLSWQLHKSSAAQSYSSLLAALYINPCLPRLHLQEMLPGDVHMPGQDALAPAVGLRLCAQAADASLLLPQGLNLAPEPRNGGRPACIFHYKAFQATAKHAQVCGF